MVTMLQNTMNDFPVDPSTQWGGYVHMQDPTMLPSNVMTFPSQNCFIPYKDIIAPRAGMLILGQPYTVNSGIIGHAKKFKNATGTELEVRVWNSTNNLQNDVMEIFYENPLTGIEQWWQITENTNPLEVGIHRYYFAEFWDTTLNGVSLNIPRLVWVNGNQKVYSWTGGIAPIVSVTPTSLIIDPVYTWQGLGFIDPANGGTGTIVVNGVSYTATASNWNSSVLNFASTAGISTNDLAFDQIQTDNIVVSNNLGYISPSSAFVVGDIITGGTSGATGVVISDNGGTLTLNAINGVFAIGETITGSSSSTTATVSSYVPQTFKFDYCRVTKNYVMYGNWESRNLYIANNFNQVSSADIIKRFAFQDDLVVSNEGGYMESYPTTIRYEIDSVTPLPQTQAAYSSSSVAGNDLVFRFERNPIARTVYTVTITVVGTPDTFQVFENGVPFGAPTAITGSEQTILPAPMTDNGLFITFGHTTGHTVGDTWTFTYGGQDTYKWFINGVLQQEFQPVNISLYSGQNPPASSILGGVTMKTNSTYNHVVGDYWEVLLNPLIERAWANFYYSLPQRRPGEGYIARLPSNFWTMAEQEKDMYVNTSFGQWSVVEFNLSSDLKTETIDITPLKQSSRNKVLQPYLIGYLDNDIIFLTEDHRLNLIGRKQFIELPQIGNLSTLVQKDFDALTFENGSFEYLDDRLHITSPEDGWMMVYDNNVGKQYWQPPQIMQENGILSVIGNSLISHSNLRNQTNTLFVGTNDNGFAYTVKIRLPYNSYGTRWQLKTTTMTFIEGYIEGAPKLVMNVYQDINGCRGVKQHDVEPILCIPPDRAPLGEGSFGSHSLGSDDFQEATYFQEVYDKFPPIEYYFSSLELVCDSLDQRWAILSMGLNAKLSQKNNSGLKNRSILIN